MLHISDWWLASGVLTYLPKVVSLASTGFSTSTSPREARRGSAGRPVHERVGFLGPDNSKQKRKKKKKKESREGEWMITDDDNDSQSVIYNPAWAVRGFGGEVCCPEI